MKKGGNLLKLTMKDDYLKLLKSSSVGGSNWRGIKDIVGAGRKAEDLFPSAQQETKSILKDLKGY